MNRSELGPPALTGMSNPHNPQSAQRFAVTALLPEDLLWNEYHEMYVEDPEVKAEALRAAEEMRNVPLDDLDRRAMEASSLSVSAQEGVVSRRAPPNPFHSPLFGRQKSVGQKMAKLSDPALQSNPLRGKLIVTIGVNVTLFMIFAQSLVANKVFYSKYHTTFANNANLGPASGTLDELGALNVNEIRSKGEGVRLLWSMWMHSGWIHIALNIICQLQFFHMLEPDWGAIRTLSLFVISGITGNLFSAVMDPCRIAVGSSGGLFGLMGGTVPYAIEYWHTIPRPMWILIFSIVTVIISFAAGLTALVATWAHVGGFLGGLFFGFGTISSLAAFYPRERAVKKQIRRNLALNWLQQRINPDCKCGVRDWLVRVLCLALLGTMWILCFLYIYKLFEYQPLGSVTYTGVKKCCCCYDYQLTTESTLKNWRCNPCEMEFQWGGGKKTFEEICKEVGQKKKAGRVLLEWNLNKGMTENPLFLEHAVVAP